MIRVNLLEAPQTKTRRDNTLLSPGLERACELLSPGMKVLLVICLFSAANGLGWLYQQRVQQQIAVRMQAAEQVNRELAAVKAKYLERQREAENLHHRLQVIEQLRANQTGPVDLLKSLGDTVNHTEAVWLSSMRDEGASIHIEGMALSTAAVANLMSNLKKSGYFRSIEIKETFQDEAYKEAQAFQFVLTCDKMKS
ncbi:MAG: PilN domain-containing protein [Acidobacteriales bacterium]|nr:PilN domain-containing protein [Terriglobales bacterium]